jgi:hypothetical protein
MLPPRWTKENEKIVVFRSIGLQHDERGMKCTICCNFYDNSKQQGSSTKNLFLTETEVTVVDENEVEGSDTENEQEEQTEPVNVVEQTDEEDSESERESEMSSVR